MGIFKSNNATTVVQKSYTERLDDIKSIFKSAHSRASVIMNEMQSEIEDKKAQINSLNERIKEISSTQAEASKFMSNLEKFI